MRYPWSFIILFLLFSQNACSQDFSHIINRQTELISAFPESITIIGSQTDDNKKNLNFYYLSGKEANNSIMVLLPKSNNKVHFFSDEISETPYDAVHHPRGKYKDFIKSQLKKYQKVNIINNFQLVSDYPEIFKDSKQITNINEKLVKMRMIKDTYEIDNLREACKITAEGLNKVYREAEPGMTEKDLIHIMVDYFKDQGSSGASFYQAASGPHSVKIHFDATSRKIQEDDLIVFDIGAWYNNYTADISRTIPVGGKFTKPQREIYEAVLKAQKKAIKYMLPEMRLNEVKKIAEDVLIEELHKIGLVLDKESAWQRKLYIQHGFYHFIGLHVHDVWYDYVDNKQEKKYEPGMIMTMEPGLYFPVDMLDEIPSRIKDMVSQQEFEKFVKKIKPVYDKYAGMGVRIEDDVLITKDGNEVLTNDVPKEIDEIEKMMQ
jgi:Xaa-Pro aminopeptidase